jgi:aminopeptidase S
MPGHLSTSRHCRRSPTSTATTGPLGPPGYEASVEYMVGVLRDIGFKASTPTFDSSGEDGEGPSRPERNVIAQASTGDPEQVVMIGAHLDSVTDGPGIVDNGSGVATLLEIATRLGVGAEGPTGYVSSLSAADRKKISCI